MPVREVDPVSTETTAGRGDGGGTAGSLTQVEGILVGHATDRQGLTGCTVVLCPEGATCSVDVRGGAPGTRETDLLGPGRLVQQVHAVCLAGGSAFGLAAAQGVMTWLEERGYGFDTGVARVPIVPAAILFDLAVGDPRARPDAAMGYAACQAASRARAATAAGSAKPSSSPLSRTSLPPAATAAAITSDAVRSSLIRTLSALDAR